MTSIENILTLAGNAGIDLSRAKTRSEMKRMVLAFYDRQDRENRKLGRTMYMDQHDMRVLDAFEIKSFRNMLRA